MSSRADSLLRRLVSWPGTHGLPPICSGPLRVMGGVLFVDFYARRVQRILPAWLFDLVVSLLLAVVFAVVKKPEGAVVCGGGGRRPRPYRGSR